MAALVLLPALAPSQVQRLLQVLQVRLPQVLPSQGPLAPSRVLRQRRAVLRRESLRWVPR